MINLIPPETKKLLHAAHTNAILLKYLALLGAAVIFLAAVCGASYLLLNSNKAEVAKLEGNSQSTLSLFSAAQKQLATIQTNITTAKNIMNQQILYSDIVTNVAAALPQGIVIEQLNVDNSMIGKPITLVAHSKTDTNVPQLKDNFSKSSMFSNFTLQSVTNTAGDPSGFPVKISISITINKGSGA